MTERRPHLMRPCPLREQDGCDWMQVTSWFVGGPDTTEEISETALRLEAELHFTSRHFVLPTSYFT